MLILTLLSLLFFPLGALFLSFIGIPLTKNKYSRIIYCLIIATVMSLIAFFYEPSQSYDLFRIFERANWMKESNLTRIIEIFGSGLEIGFNLSIFIIIR